jgi:hypothetical protein
MSIMAQAMAKRGVFKTKDGKTVEVTEEKAKKISEQIERDKRTVAYLQNNIPFLRKSIEGEEQFLQTLNLVKAKVEFFKNQPNLLVQFIAEIRFPQKDVERLDALIKESNAKLTRFKTELGSALNKLSYLKEQGVK